MLLVYHSAQASYPHLETGKIRYAVAMLIGVHIVVGAGIGSLLHNPLGALAAGMISHFIGDKIPHWEYSAAPLEKLREKKGIKKIKACLEPDTLRVLSYIALEIFSGFFLVWLLLAARNAGPREILAAFSGGIGGLLPDVLWGIAENSPFRLLKLYRKFHHTSHTVYKNGRAVYTLGWQIVAVALSGVLLLRI